MLNKYTKPSRMDRGWIKRSQEGEGAGEHGGEDRVGKIAGWGAVGHGEGVAKQTK